MALRSRITRSLSTYHIIIYSYKVSPKLLSYPSSPSLSSTHTQCPFAIFLSSLLNPSPPGLTSTIPTSIHVPSQTRSTPPPSSTQQQDLSPPPPVVAVETGLSLPPLLPTTTNSFIIIIITLLLPLVVPPVFPSLLSPAHPIPTTTTMSSRSSPWTTHHLMVASLWRTQLSTKTIQRLLLSYPARPWHPQQKSPYAQPKPQKK